MRELSVIEMNEVAGAYSWDFSSVSSTIASAVLNAGELAICAVGGAAAGAMTGGYVGGRHGGDGGGLLGFGIIAEGVGLIAGAVLAGIAGSIYFSVIGLDASLVVAGKVADGFLNGTIA